MRQLSAVVLTLSAVLAYPRMKNRSAAELESDTATRVARLNKRFGELLRPTAIEKLWVEACKVNCANASSQIRDGSARAREQWIKAMNAVASQIHGEIDAYIAGTVRPGHVAPRAVRQGLKRILGTATDGSPSVFVIAGDDSPSFIVVYTLRKGTLMGPGATSVTLRAYTPSQGKYRFAAATGEDMDGYADISLAKLHSPSPHGIWLLLSGRMTGANGPNIRMRLYSYDATGFRLVWAPENEWGTFTISVTDRGFAVDGDYYRKNKMRHDVYLLAEDGVYRVLP